MSKRKGVSADEKRTRMLQLFYEKKEFFQLKDLEKIAPKEKGIIAQSVKDVVQVLVDDGLVDSDKIGTSVYFWAFPSKAKHVRKRKLTELQEKYEMSCKKLKLCEENILAAKVGRDNNDERIKVLEEIEVLQKKENEVFKEVQKYKDNDPEMLQRMKDEMKDIKEATNRWTDNIFSLKSWIKNKFFIEDATLNKQFGIPDELEYVDV